MLQQVSKCREQQLRIYICTPRNIMYISKSGFLRDIIYALAISRRNIMSYKTISYREVPTKEQDILLAASR